MSFVRTVARTALWVCVALILAPYVSRALPGEVLAEQKISALAGGFGAGLDTFDELGLGAEGIGDLNGDGVNDAAIGAWRDDDGGSDRGAVYILFLAADGTVASKQKISQTSGGFAGSLSDFDRFGSSIASLGDLDGDGVVDLAVSAYDDDLVAVNAGTVWILFLNTDGTVKDERRIDGLSGAEDRFGRGLVKLGDLDGDGTPELAVGAFTDQDGSMGGTGPGAVYVLFLRPDGTVRHSQKISALEGGFAGPLADDDRFGARLAALGDLDGDGVPDLAAGAFNGGHPGTNIGSVFVLFLDTDGTVKSHREISEGQSGFAGDLDSGDEFGFGLAAAGDLNGDGVADLIVGAHRDDDSAPAGGVDTGALWVLFLNTDGSVSGHQKISATSGGFGGVLDTGVLFGASVAGLGDLDGDGVGDFISGSLRDDDGGTRRGAAWVLSLDGAPLVCGNGVIDPVEECDDGNIHGLDGCTATCELEDALHLFGTAQTTGLLTVDLDGVIVNVSVLAGDTPLTLSSLLATAINGTPSLSQLGTTAQSIGHAVTVNGRFGLASLTAIGMHVSVDPGAVIDEHKISEASGGFTGNLVQQFGDSMSAIGDVNGDGVEDMAVGERFDGPGSVWVLLMNADGTVASEQEIGAGQGGFGGVLDSSDRFGDSVAGLGDLDGDGVVDLAVGASGDDDGASDAGAVWILFLDTDGTVKSEQKLSLSAGGFPAGLAISDHLGNSLASLGDLDGDGVTDIAVGAWLGDDGGSSAGDLWVLFLNSNGTVKAFQKVSAEFGDFGGALDVGDRFATCVSSLGDLDGDGVVDLAVCANGDDDGGSERGAVWILFLEEDGTVREHQKISDTTVGFDAPFAFFGSSAAAPGDLDGDGVLDLVVGGSGPDGQSVFVLFLNPNGTVKGHHEIAEGLGGFAGSLDFGDFFGLSVAFVPDLGISRGILAVGASGDDGSGTNTGAVWMLDLDQHRPAVCGDSIVAAPELCDDGNTASGDGCFQTCQPEDEIEFIGTAQGGTVQVVVSGISLLLFTPAGQESSAIAGIVADLINVVPGFQVAGISAEAIGGRVVTDGVFDSVTIGDPGILLPEPGSLAMLAAGGLLLRGLHARRRARRLREGRV